MEVGRRDTGSRRTMSQINVTPFVDVMLVLLIIFMVTAPMMEQGFDVNLPEVDNAPGIASKEEPLVVTYWFQHRGEPIDGHIDLFIVEVCDLG